MNNPKKSMVAMLLSAAVLCPRISVAMEIQMYDAMATEDQQDYLKYLVKAAQKVFIEQGREDLATKVNQLFHATKSGDRRSLGAAQFQENLEQHRAFIAEDAGKFPFSPLVGQVEDVLVVTLYKNHIDTPFKFMRRLAGLVREKPFWPKTPLRTS